MKRNKLCSSHDTCHGELEKWVKMVSALEEKNRILVGMVAINLLAGKGIKDPKSYFQAKKLVIEAVEDCV